MACVVNFRVESEFVWGCIVRSLDEASSDGTRRPTSTSYCRACTRSYSTAIRCLVSRAKASDSSCPIHIEARKNGWSIWLAWSLRNNCGDGRHGRPPGCFWGCVVGSYLCVITCFQSVVCGFLDLKSFIQRYGPIPLAKQNSRVE